MRTGRAAEIFLGDGAQKEIGNDVRFGMHFYLDHGELVLSGLRR